MPDECAICVPLLRAKEENSMARKVGQIIARGDRRWLIRVYLGRDHETKKRNYHNRTIPGSMREAQAYLTKKLGERHLGRELEERRSHSTSCGSRKCHRRRGANESATSVSKFSWGFRR